jgi:hypothetical protein
MYKEPAAIVAAITGAAVALIALVVSFGLDLTNDQQSAILGVVAVAAPVIAGFVIRSKVFSPKTRDEAVSKAAQGNIA